MGAGNGLPAPPGGLRVVLEPPGSAEPEPVGVWTSDKCRAVRRVLDGELVLGLQICSELLGHPEPSHRDSTEDVAWRGP